MSDVDRDDWREHLGDVFERALARPPDRRAAFVAEACGDDDALRDEVMSLLAAHAAAPGYLDRLSEAVLPNAFATLPTPLALDGRVGDRYYVLEELGRGGMGVVYKARDVDLDRLVALKVLPLHLAQDDDARDRLRREARATSALDHPNLAPIYEICRTADGALFIAMAYVDGETLRQRIERGPLSVHEATGLARQIASGLAAAHRRGVIHRDVKPSNVLVAADGTVKLVDFGIARTAEPSMTRQGTRLGSLTYMSPEQTRGESVDLRTDLWALGVVIYEMLAGAPPFAAVSDEALVVRIRSDAPPPLAHVPPDAPLVAVMRRCLEKDPERRFSTAEDLLAVLDGDAEAEDRRVGLVVLPFANLSPDPDDAYVGAGLTEEVITDLSHLGSLRVISRASAMRLQAGEADSRTVARELGVRYVVEGSVRKSRDALRISVRLVDAHAEGVIWAQRLDGGADEVFDLQERVANEIAGALHLRLSPKETLSLAARPIPDPRAYESFLRARYEAYRFSQEGLDRARRYIETALAIVGDNDLLYSTLGHITAMYVDAGIEAGPPVLARIDALADRVFTLNPSSARGHWLKAFSAFYRGDVFEAVRFGERALALGPDEPDALILLGYVYGHVGRTAEARDLFEQALRLDPLTPLTAVMPGFVAAFEGRADSVVEPYRRGVEMEPDSPFAGFFYGWALAFADRTGEARPVLDDVADRFGTSPFGALARSLACALRGDTTGAVRAITPELSGAARGSGMFARELTHCYALAGEPEQALDWLEHAVGLGLLHEAFLAEHDPFLAPVRGTPRFEALLTRVRSALDR
jgi:TolB-like protein/predicted Ser/Thr protein kinase